MRPSGRPQRAAHRHGGGTRYTVGPAAVVDPYPAAGLCAVYVPTGSATAIYYCEPTTGRCSCGAPAGSCSHIATITAALIRLQRSRMSAAQEEAMQIPDRLTEDQEEILITLRALAGLVAQTLRRKAALDVGAGAEAMERASAEVLFWRAFLLHHTRRLLPALVGTAHARAYRRFAEDLVRAVYLEDGDAIARHGCDPATCTHEAHVRD